jgi:hypothetical protein
MRSASLFFIFVVAKALSIGGCASPVTGWSVATYFWQDAMVALIFWGAEIALRRLGAVTHIIWSSLLDDCDIYGHQYSGRAHSLYSAHGTHASRRAGAVGRFHAGLSDRNQCSARHVGSRRGGRFAFRLAFYDALCATKVFKMGRSLWSSDGLSRVSG